MNVDLKTEFPNAVIIWGRQGSGMTRNAQLLAALYGKDTVCELEAETGAQPFPDNYLVLTNREDVAGAISFEEAMSRVGRVHLIAPGATPRFCRDCAHVRYDGPRSTCSAPQEQTISVVTGPVNKPCLFARSPSSACGIDARLFLAKAPLHINPPRTSAGHSP